MNGSEEDIEKAPLSEDESTQVVDESYEELFNFQRVSGRLSSLIKDWTCEQNDTLTRRKQRKLDVDVEALRNVDDGLKADETFIPIRVIDTNIRREQPQLIAFLTQSPRLAIFECHSDPNVEVTNIETDFTKGMTYVNWESPFFGVIDGAQTHGWDAVEIEYDETKPLKTNIYHCGHDKVIFSLRSRDFQSNEIVLIEHEISILKLKDLARKNSFDTKQVNTILEKFKNQQDENKSSCIKIYKKFCKYNGTVYVSWFCMSDCDDWLSAPTKLWRNRKRKKEVTVIESQPVPGAFDPMTGQPMMLDTPVKKMIEEPIFESLYPIRLYRYQKTEEPEIAETKGRVWLDLPKQEAQSCLYTNFVNASCRSSNIYGSPKFQQGNGGQIKRLELDLTPGCVYSEPLELFSPPSPSFDLLRGAQALDTQNQVETGNIATATLNSKDSRKTSKEIEVASQEKNLISSVQVTLFSTFLREVWIDAWSMVQSFAINGEIKFCLIEDPNFAALIQQQGIPPEAAGKAPLINDVEKISLDYDLKAAGDKDVVERQQTLEKRQLLWPIVSQTALAMPFLTDLIKEMLPRDGDKYAKLLEQAQVEQSQAAVLLNVLKEAAAAGRPITAQEVAQIEQSMNAGSQQPQQTEQ